jgi:predicted RNase H-like HicB family nuclease
MDIAADTVRESSMQTVRYVDRQEGDAYLGYCVDYPGYWKQGRSPDELREQLRDSAAN